MGIHPSVARANKIARTRGGEHGIAVRWSEILRHYIELRNRMNAHKLERKFRPSCRFFRCHCCWLPLLTVPLAKFWSGDAIIGLTLFICGIAGVAMSAMTFGDEFSNRTLGLLLTQPLSRSKIWRRKMLVLGVAVAVCFLAVGTRVFIHLGCYFQTSTFLDLGLVALFLPSAFIALRPFGRCVSETPLGAIAVPLRNADLHDVLDGHADGILFSAMGLEHALQYRPLLQSSKAFW